MSWTTVKEIKERLLKLWNSGRLLKAECGEESLFPLSLKLKGPTSKELSTRFAEVSAWINELTARSVPLTWRTTNHRIIGTNQIPTHAEFSTLDQVGELLRKTGELQEFRRLKQLMVERNPVLVGWLARRPIQALELSPVWPRLLDVVEWMTKNSNPGLYLRQVDLPGVDTKFFEQHKGVLSELFDLAEIAREEVGGFEKRYGFLERPVRIRWRPAEAWERYHGLTEVTVTREDFSNTDPGYGKVIVVENEINFLAFPPVRDAMVVFGSGYKVGALQDIPWLRGRPVYYWGDIDTHGFAILHQVRGYYPQTRSLLMDRATFLSHQEQWVTEPRQVRVPLDHLTEDEQSLYQDLLHEEYGANLRLEQELISFSLVRDEARRIELE